MLGLVSGTVKGEVLPLLSDIGELLGDLLCAVIGLVVNALDGIASIVLSLVDDLASLILKLDLKVAIQVLGIKL